MFATITPDPRKVPGTKECSICCLKGRREGERVKRQREKEEEDGKEVEDGGRREGKMEEKERWKRRKEGEIEKGGEGKEGWRKEGER